jgi:hypothetical protein
LKVNLGITDYLLADHKEVSGVAEQLGRLAIENLFDLWLRSGLQKVDLGSRLSQLSTQWVHADYVLRTWFAVCLGLSQRLLYILYGLRCRTSHVWAG